MENERPDAAKLRADVVEKKKPLSMRPRVEVERRELKLVQSVEARYPFWLPLATWMESVPAEKSSGPETVVDCTTPVALVFKSEPWIFETVRLEVEAIPVERTVVVAPVAVTFWKPLVPVKVLFMFVFAIVVDAVMTVPTRASVYYLLFDPSVSASVVVLFRSAMNDEVARVYAVTRAGQLAAGGVDTKDFHVSVLEFAKGTVVSMENSWILSRDNPSLVDFKLDLVGEKGQLQADPTHSGGLRRIVEVILRERD